MSKNNSDTEEKRKEREETERKEEIERRIIYRFCLHSSLFLACAIPFGTFFLKEPTIQGSMGLGIMAITLAILTVATKK